MWNLSGCLIRRFAGVSVVVAVAVAVLVAAPVALAQGLPITTAVGIQFSGSVDDNSCGPTSAVIYWGDETPTSPGTYDPSDDQISGTHTYAKAGSFTGTVTLTGGSCNPDTPDSFTATVEPAPQFKQCPPDGDDFGCQFLIVVTNSGTTVERDTNQGPYDGSDDSLVGVVNNSTTAVAELPLSVPGSDLFGFDGDGICDPGVGPFPSACTYPAGCVPGSTCSFPPPPGQPAGYTEPGAISGSSQNGYEGPTTWFSNVSADTSSGQVNFSPALAPGQNTYFGLEGPPTGTTIGVGRTAPLSTTALPPSVTSSTGASFSGIVDPNGSATTAYFQYGTVLSDRGPGESTAMYDQSTPVQTVGSDFAEHTVTASVSGLIPNTTYNVQLVATNGVGTSFGPNETFTTPKGPPPPPPTLGKTVNASPISGVVFVKPPAGKTLGKAGDRVAGAALGKGQGFEPLTEARQIPTGSEVDALHGTLKIVTATGHVGKTQHATISGGVFKLTQTRTGISKGLTNLSLQEGAFKGAPSYASCKAKTNKAIDEATIAKLSSRTLQLLRASAHGKFRTTGRYSAATVRGTVWTIADRCDGTLTHVIRDTVLVQDFVRHTTILLHPGQSYLARAIRGRHRR